jgi:hypothetical protein
LTGTEAASYPFCLLSPVSAPEREHMRTVLPKVTEVDRRWHVIDANAQVLGRIATVAAWRHAGRPVAIAGNGRGARFLI